MSYMGAYHQTRTLIGGDPPTRHRSILPVNDNGTFKLTRHGYTLAIMTPSGALVRGGVWVRAGYRQELRGIRDALSSMGWRSTRMGAPWSSLLRRQVMMEGSSFDRWVKPT